MMNYIEQSALTDLLFVLLCNSSTGRKLVTELFILVKEIFSLCFNFSRVILLGMH